jgi:hypothetical protein
LGGQMFFVLDTTFPFMVSSSNTNITKQQNVYTTAT